MAPDRNVRQVRTVSQVASAMQVLQDRYGGWLSERVVGDYLKFANAVFSALGDRVTLWATFNEPWTFCFNGYGTGSHAPGMPVRWHTMVCDLRPSGCNYIQAADFHPCSHPACTLPRS